MYMTLKKAAENSGDQLANTKTKAFLIFCMLFLQIYGVAIIDPIANEMTA